uniref:Spermatogenesis associated 48 n=1 Tax=Apteryx owenii TaxID=8824 RepID=A0A8B9S8F3_APTOW
VIMFCSKMPFTKSPMSAEPLYKMDRQQYRNLLKKMCMPFVRGPENRHDFASFEEKDSNSFLKFNPYTSPGELNYPLFPHRDDVSLVDPCSGFVTIESLVNYSDVKPHQWVPISGKRGQTAHRRQMILLEETSQDRRWNSRAVSAASIRAQLGGWRTLVKVAPAPPHQKHIFAFHVNPNLKVRVCCSCNDAKHLNHVTSNLAYEEVSWDNILPSKIQPPESTVEVMADPVSQYFTRRRYNPESEISQVVGGLWDRFQTRSFTSPQRPVDFHISSLYSFNLLFLALLPLTFSFSTPNIPGYTGKVHWTAAHLANSNLPSTSPSIIAQMHGYIAKHGRSSQYNHQGPFPQMLTPVSPQNSFNKVQQQTIKV